MRFAQQKPLKQIGLPKDQVGSEYVGVFESSGNAAFDGDQLSA